MTKTFRVALIQNSAERDMAPSIAALEPLIRAAARDGGELIQLTEMCTMMEPDDSAVLAKAKSEADDPGLATFRRLAAELRRWIHVGSLLIRDPGQTRVANRAFVIDGEGKIRARYDKIHLFDVAIGDGQSYQESAMVAPGGKAVIAATPWGLLGLSVCYDLRFPQLYRALAKADASFLTIPAAFTHTTGTAHWHVLQRARAIETGCFVIAPAQCGLHENKRRTYGHSLIVDPWGKILAEGDEEPGVFIAEIDPAKVAEARARVPALTHDRPFTLS